MMAIRRVVALAAALALSSNFVLAQSAKPDTKKREQAGTAGNRGDREGRGSRWPGQPAPTDIQMTITPYFLKSQEQTFVPFVLDVKGAPVADAAMYVRVVDPAAKPDPKAKKVEYPWTTSTSFRSPARQRKLEPRVHGRPRHLRPVYRDEGAPGRKGAQNQDQKDRRPQANRPHRFPERRDQHQLAAHHRQGEHAERADQRRRAARASVRLRRPGLSRPPTWISPRPKSCPSSSRSTTPVSTSLCPTSRWKMSSTRRKAKPKFFNKTNPQTVSAANLPLQFDPAKFPVPGGITVPLASFGEGQYRLSIKISDKVLGKVLTRDVNFTVKAS